jgi:quercetin 2,3-dioxygenase
MRTIKAVRKAVYEPIADPAIFRVMPSASVPMNALDPFIFLNRHGHQEYLATIIVCLLSCTAGLKQ